MKRGKSRQKKCGVKEKHERAFPEKMPGITAFFEKRGIEHKFLGGYWRKKKRQEDVNVG